MSLTGPVVNSLSEDSEQEGHLLSCAFSNDVFRFGNISLERMCLFVIEIQTHHTQLDVEIVMDDDFKYNKKCLEIMVILVPYHSKNQGQKGG